MRDKTIVMGMFFFLLLVTTAMVSAEVNTYGSFMQRTNITVKQTCGSCTWVNVSISYPNSTIAVSNAPMVNEGGGVFSYLFTDTRVQGRYDVAGTGDLEGRATSFDVLYFDINEYGIAASLFALYTVFYLLLLFCSYFFWYKFATKNGNGVRDANFFFWSAFLDLILFVIIEIYGFGGVDTLIVELIKYVCFASGLYFLTMGIIHSMNWKTKPQS